MLTTSCLTTRALARVLTFSLLPWLCSAICYTPNGTDRNAQLDATYEYEFYAPCNQEAAVSMCCRLGGDVNTCLPGGLCLQADGNVYWRESCTDPTWTDPVCVKLFLNGTEGPNATVSDVSIWPCDDGSWCDNDQGTGLDCCMAGGGYFVGVNGEQTRTNPNATSSTTSSTTTSSSSLMTSTSAAATARPTESSPASQGHHTTSALGVGLGVGLGMAVLLIGIGALLYILKARRKREKIPAMKEPSVDQVPVEKSSHPVYEMQDEIPKGGDVQREASGQRRKPVPQRPYSAVEME